MFTPVKFIYAIAVFYFCGVALSDHAQYVFPMCAAALVVLLVRNSIKTVRRGKQLLQRLAEQVG